VHSKKLEVFLRTLCAFSILGSLARFDLWFYSCSNARLTFLQLWTSVP